MVKHWTFASIMSLFQEYNYVIFYLSFILAEVFSRFIWAQNLS